MTEERQKRKKKKGGIWKAEDRARVWLEIPGPFWHIIAPARLSGWRWAGERDLWDGDRWVWPPP